MSSICPNCGNPEVVHEEGTFTVNQPANLPGGPIAIENAAWEVCPNCGEITLPPELVARLDATRCERLGLLTPNEIRAVREEAGLSQTAMAQFLGTGEKTYSRWESGRSFQNKSSDNLIRLAKHFPDLLVQFEAQRDPRRKEIIANYLSQLDNLKGESTVAMAAHGIELDLSLASELQERLRKIQQDRTPRE